MKRVICLYRVSTIGQVDHDDIPMQKTACREYAASHPDWQIIDEISEKGVSGYKLSSDERDAIVEIKRRASLHQFDVLLVFMFDRLGRRDDETPFVVQWFVQQGIEVWSAREGEQRFDSHVDKLMNYIRFWQASGESEKTAIRVRTKHSQMIQDGQWRGGLLAYGYHLVQKGRVNKKNQPVPDLEIDENEAKVVREIYHLLVKEGYGTNRVAKHLNEMGIKTKRGTTLWRGTSIRAMIENPIYKGVLRFGLERSEPFEHLKIVDEITFDKCLEIVKGRACRPTKANLPQEQSASRSLLTGLLYCADCGSKLCFSHNTTRRSLADGTLRLHERDLYRCYRKISAPSKCAGQSSYHVDPINEAVENEIRGFLARIGSIPEKDLLQLANDMMVQLAKPLQMSGEMRPTDMAAVLAPNKDGKPAVFPMIWGFSHKAVTVPIVNCRLENADKKELWKDSWYRRRCIIPASWYYEWEHFKDANGKKKTGAKYRIELKDDAALLLAGLYRIEERNGLQVPVFSIITQDAAEELKSLHDRMPLILSYQDAVNWMHIDCDPREIAARAVTGFVIEKVT